MSTEEKKGRKQYRVYCHDDTDLEVSADYFLIDGQLLKFYTKGDDFAVAMVSAVRDWHWVTEE
jgi:hypothetical protein